MSQLIYFHLARPGDTASAYKSPGSQFKALQMSKAAIWHQKTMLHYIYFLARFESPHSPSSLGSNFDPFNYPDVDDPVAQALSKMIQPDDKVGHLLSL